MDAETDPASRRLTHLRYRHWHWALGIFGVVSSAMTMLFFGLPKRADDVAAELGGASMGVLLLIGGILYARGQEAGRRIVDAAYYVALVPSSWLLVSSLRDSNVHDSVFWCAAVVWLLWWRLELWRPDVLSLVVPERPAAPHMRMQLLVRMLATVLAVTFAGALWRW